MPAPIAREVAAFNAKIAELTQTRDAFVTGAILALGAPEGVQIAIDGDHFVEQRLGLEIVRDEVPS